MFAGDSLAGHQLRAPDIALLCALGWLRCRCTVPQCVGVLSTGDEIIGAPSQPALPHQIWDANRPMLWSWCALCAVSLWILAMPAMSAQPLPPLLTRGHGRRM